MKTRTEAPVGTVQDVNIRNGRWADCSVSDVLTVSTATKAAAWLRECAEPDAVQKLSVEGKARAFRSPVGQQKEILRRQLIGGLHLALPIPERIRPLAQCTRTGWRRGSTHRPRIEPRVAAGVQPQAGQIIWRNSRVNLVARAVCRSWLRAAHAAILRGPTGAGLFSCGMASSYAHHRGDGVPGLAYPVALRRPSGCGIDLYWRNDDYVVTDDSFIDIEAKPLALSYQRREGRLDSVQTAFAEQKGFCANVYTEMSGS